MNQRHFNLFTTKHGRSGTLAVVAVVLAVLITGMLAACKTAAGSVPPGTAPGTSDPAAPSASAQADASPVKDALPPEKTSNEDSDEVTALVKAWAEAVRMRDGRVQYEFYTQALKETFLDDYEALDWVTGTSSPWVDDYDIELTSDGAVVTFHYMTSTGPAGSEIVNLEFGKEKGAVKISGIDNTGPLFGD